MRQRSIMCHGERYVFLFVQNAKGSTKKRRHHIVVCSTKEKSKTSHCCVQHQIHVKATRKLKPYVQYPRMQTSWKPCCPLAREKSRHESSELIEYFVIHTHWTCRLQADKLHRTVNSEKVEYKAIHTYAIEQICIPLSYQRTQRISTRNYIACAAPNSR